MKHKIPTALLAASILLTLCLTGCGGPSAEVSTPPTASPAITSQTPEADRPSVEPQETNVPAEPAASGSNILVVWFSRVGITPFEDGVDAESSASINVRDGELVGHFVPALNCWTGWR